MKKPSMLWWVVIIAFALGEGIVLTILAVCQTMYVSDPLLICGICAGITIVIAMLFSGFTVKSDSGHTYAEYVEIASNGKRTGRPLLDTDPEDIDMVDKLLRKENANVQAETPKRGKHEAKASKA